MSRAITALIILAIIICLIAFCAGIDVIQEYGADELRDDDDWTGEDL